jgi:hypothetical protein
MKAKIVKVSSKSSIYGGIFYYMFFKSQSGDSYKSCIYPKMRNFNNWRPVIDRFLDSADDIWLDGLNIKDDKLVDADSNFNITTNSGDLYGRLESVKG